MNGWALPPIKGTGSTKRAFREFVRASALLTACLGLAAACAPPPSRPSPEEGPLPRPAEAPPKDRPAKALFVEGVNRFEYRALRVVLSESDTFNYQVLLLTPRDLRAGGPMIVHSTPGPGLEPLESVPETFDDYDVVILGDIDPDAFGGSEAAARLARRVRAGGGLVVVCGQEHTPRSWLSTPLREILPFDEVLGYRREGAFIRLTESGRAHAAARLDRDDARNQAIWKEIGGLTGVVRVRGIPGPEAVLLEAEIATDGRSAPKAVPEPVLLAVERDQGRVAVVLTDTLHQLKHFVTGRSYGGEMYRALLRWAGRRP